MTFTTAPVDRRSSESAAAPRVANSVYVMPHTWANALHVLAPLVELTQPDPRVQVLILTADAESAATTAAAAARLCQDKGINVVAGTSPDRAARLVQTLPAQIVAGSPSIVLALMKRGVLKLDTLRAVAIAWANEVLTAHAPDAIESIFADVPKDAARVIVTAALDPAVEDLAERYAWRARRFAEPPRGATAPQRVQYVASSASGKFSTLRRVLDALDPSAAFVYAQPDNEQDVRSALQGSGLSAAGSIVRVGQAAAETDDLTILFDLPPSNEALEEALGATRRVVALIQPRQLVSLRAIAGEGAVTPLPLPEAADRARDAAAQTREALRRELARGEIGREVLELEPLLEEYDGIEIAAAALKLLEQSRAEERQTPPAPAERSHRVPLFVNAGSRDGVTARDLTAAIAAAASIPPTDVGPITIRESHSIVEVESANAESVIEHVTGSTLRGRRLVARRERPRPPREGGDRSRPARGAGDRPRRSDRRPRSRE